MNPRHIITTALLLALTALQAVPLTILYIGDTHGVYKPEQIMDGNHWRGGYAILEERLYRERGMSRRSIYLDSGDQQTGTFFSSLVVDGVHGGAVVDVFNQLKLDAATFGNHEFDFSYSNTLDLARRAQYPFVSTNLLDKSTRRSISGKPYAIIERDSLKIGVLGVTLEYLGEKVKAQNVSSVRILPAADAIYQYLDELDIATDLIVVLSHQGYVADSLLAENLDDRVDLIIGGHDHITAEQPYLVNGIYLLYAGSHLQFLGKAKVEVEDDRIVSLNNRLVPLITSTREFLMPVANFVKAKTADIEAEMSRLIGQLNEEWIPDKYQSTSVSRWVANSLAAEYSALYNPDFAIINNGGIRKAIPAGPLTLGDMYELLPFNNTVVTFDCTGKDLLAYQQLNALNAVDRPHDICESTIADFGALQPDRVYRVISHDYIAGQWDKYLGFKPGNVYDTGELILDAMIRQAQSQFMPPEADRD